MAIGKDEKEEGLYRSPHAISWAPFGGFRLDGVVQPDTCAGAGSTTCSLNNLDTLALDLDGKDGSRFRNDPALDGGAPLARLLDMVQSASPTALWRAHGAPIEPNDPISTFAFNTESAQGGDSAPLSGAEQCDSVRIRTPRHREDVSSTPASSVAIAEESPCEELPCCGKLTCDSSLDDSGRNEEAEARVSPSRRTRASTEQLPRRSMPSRRGKRGGRKRSRAASASLGVRVPSHAPAAQAKAAPAGQQQQETHQGQEAAGAPCTRDGKNEASPWDWRRAAKAAARSAVALWDGMCEGTLQGWWVALLLAGACLQVAAVACRSLWSVEREALSVVWEERVALVCLAMAMSAGWGGCWVLHRVAETFGESHLASFFQGAAATGARVAGGFVLRILADASFTERLRRRPTSFLYETTSQQACKEEEEEEDGDQSRPHHDAETVFDQTIDVLGQMPSVLFTLICIVAHRNTGVMVWLLLGCLALAIRCGVWRSGVLGWLLVHALVLSCTRERAQVPE